MIVNSNTLNGLRTTFTSLYTTALTMAQPQWSKLAMKVPSSNASNTYGWLGTSQQIREWIGDRVIQNLSEYDYTIKNKKFESTVGVQRDNIEDDNLGVYKPLVEQMGFNTAMFPDEMIFDLMLNGFTQKGYDGQNFFDTDHPGVDKDGNVISVSNSGGGAGNPWFLLDMSKPIKPFIFQERRPFAFKSFDDPNDKHVFMNDEFVYGVDGRMNVGYGLWQLAFGSKQTLDATAFEAAKKSMQLLTAENGKPLRIKPTVLVVGPSNEGAANEIVKKERLANGETNINLNTVEILVVPELG